MADLTYKVNVDTSQATKAISGLEKTIGGLRNALGGLAIGSFIANAYRTAQAVNDLAETTGFATQTILGLGKAFQENGSSIQGAEEAIARFTRNVGEAAAGSANLQQSFREVGISLSDLGTMTEEELFLKTVKGLGNITDAATRARLASDLLGKNARANFAGIAGSVDGYIAASANAAKANEAANKAAENFERAITNLREQLLIVLTPISELAANINIGSKAMGDFVKAASSVALVIGSFTLLGKALSALRAGFGLVGGGVVALKQGFQSLAKTKELIIYQFRKFIAAGEFTAATLAGIQKRFKYLGQGIGLLINGLKSLGGVLATVFAAFAPDTVLNAFKKLGQSLGLIKDDATEAADYIDKLNADSTAAWIKQQQNLEQEQAAQRQVINALKEKISVIQQVGEAYALQNQEIIDSINNEAKYIGMTEKMAEVERARDEILKRTKDTVAGLEQQKAKLTDKEYEQKKAIDDTIASINKQAQADITRVETAIENLQRERDAIQARNLAIELGEQLRQDTASLDAMREEINMLYMTQEQRDAYSKKLESEGRLKERLAAIDKEAAIAGKNATDSQIADWERRRQAAIEYYNSENALREQYKIALEDQSRQIDIWSKETKKALEDSISPANQVKTFWDSLSTQIDGFARTGKFKVKEFLASIIQDFIAAKLKLAALDFLNALGLGGGGGLLGGKIIPGFLAGGGNAQQGKPYIVGEKGPELFVPPTAGRVVPNHNIKDNMVSAPVTNNYITNNINALDARSVAELFAANRKTLLGTVKLAEKELPYAA